jgi:hypothetical protein
MLLMAVRSVRFGDLSAVRLLDGAENARLVAPSPLDEPTTAVRLALVSTWQGFRRTVYSFILRSPDGPQGFIQGTVRPNREAWDIVRLACLADPDEAVDGVCTSLVEQFCQATGSRGSLRTFARVPVGGEALRVLSRAGFRQYTTEYTLVRPPLDEDDGDRDATIEGTFSVDGAPEGVRLRQADDLAWSIFVHLYCAVTPQTVRHAEGRSSKDWWWSHRLIRRALGRWLVTDELVLERAGRVAGWLRVHPARCRGYQQLELLASPEVGEDIVGFVRCGLALGGPRASIQPVACRVREYDVEVLHALEECGFRIVSKEALLVKHSTARVTERQLLVAALRAQGLARIDLSRYQGTSGDIPTPTISASRHGQVPAAPLAAGLLRRSASEERYGGSPSAHKGLA